MFFAIAFHLAGSRGLQKLQIAPLIKKEIDKMQHVLVYFFNVFFSVLSVSLFVLQT